MSYAVVRVRSSSNKSSSLERTLDQLNLSRVNHCTIVPEEKTYRGMLNRVKDFVTWGEIDSEVLSKMIEKRSNLQEEVPDEFISEHTEYDSLKSFAEAVVSEEIEIGSLDGLKNLFRMPPPIGGYKSVKKPYNTGGSLGYRADEINDLIERMMRTKKSSDKDG